MVVEEPAPTFPEGRTFNLTGTKIHRRVLRGSRSSVTEIGYTRDKVTTKFGDR